MKGSWIAAGLALALAAPRARAEESFGAVGAPVLPSGGLALYAMAGFPELRAGFREGLGSLELGAQAGFDYLQVKVWAVGDLRAPLLDSGDLRLGLELSAGLFGDGGASGSDDYNQGGSGLRLGAGSFLTYKTGWPISLMAFVRVPLEVPLTSGGTLRVAALGGGGAEIAVGATTYISVQGAFGPELRRIQGALPGGLTGNQSTRLEVQALIGLGFRMF